MATSYGYGGEFSSDEDVDKLDRQPERASKFDSHQAKPSKGQIESIISTIRGQPVEEDLKINDDFLAGILDYYKTPRGPIVDSTRNLYKKIILRQIRGDQQDSTTNGDNKQATNGNSNGDGIKNVIVNNNNEFNPINKRQPMFETPSSDEDEPMLPVSQEPILKNNLISRVIQNSNDDDKLDDQMDVDDVEPTPVGPIRVPETIDIPTTDDEEEQNSDTDESSGLESGKLAANLLDTTASNGDEGVRKTHVTSTPISYKVTPKRSELIALKKTSTKEQTKSSSTKDVQSVDIQQPYRRSMRVAATRLSKSPASKTSRSVGFAGGKVMDSVESSEGLSGRRKSGYMKFFILAIVIALLAYSVYHFKSDILSSTQRVMRKVDIKF